jgi:hypothetical protein
MKRIYKIFYFSYLRHPRLSAAKYSISASLRLCGLLFLLLIPSIVAQDYPKKIRGYKLQKTKISVKNVGEKTNDKDDSEAFVTLGEPDVTDVSLTGVTLEITVEMSAVEHSGKVEFLTFKDFRVNGMSVDIAEYQNPFEFEKNQKITLPKPIKIFVGTGQSVLGALGQVVAPKQEWDVTGTVFVFGKFKKAGFNFKRVVPVPVNIKIKNPVKSKQS